MSLRHKTSKGQAVVMVTFGLIAMMGLMGLTVDLGWSFFVEKQAKAAADAAALGAVQEAMLRLGGNTGNFGGCGANPTDNTGVYCTASATTAANCTNIISTPASNLYSACLYAKNNGFDWADARQKITVTANAGTPPTAPGVNDVAYWVTVRTTQTVPQIFTRIFGNTDGTVAARSTAAIVSTVVPGSLILINRENDCLPIGPSNSIRCGVNLLGGGGGTVRADSGIRMASQCNGTNAGINGCGDGKSKSGYYAGELTGSTSVKSNSTQIRGKGWYSIGSGTWDLTPVNGFSDGSTFQDPTVARQGGPLPQPPLMASSPIPTCGFLNGQINQASPGTPVNLGPFNYYSYHLNGSTVVPDSSGIRLTGDNINFVPSATTAAGCPGGQFNNGGGSYSQTSNFPSYIFYGGVDVNQNSHVTFGAGQYVFAGVDPANNVLQGNLLNFTAGSSTTIVSSGSGDTYAGNMFIFTAPDSTDGTGGYPGLSTQINTFTELQTASANLRQGAAGFKTGNANQIDVTLNGFNKNGTNAPTALDPYNGILFWQDRRNSYVNLDPNTGIPNNAGGCSGLLTSDGTNCGKTTTKQTADLMTTLSPRMDISASPNVNLNGVMYQTRGGWTNLQAGGNYAGPLQLITGTLVTQGSPEVRLQPTALPLIKFVTALIE